MNAKEIIASGLLESYVLGTTTAEETAQVEDLCKKFPELLAEIELIETSLIHFSARLAAPLNPGLKTKILSQLDTSLTGPAAKTIPLTKNTLGLYKFGMAASLLLFISSFVYILLLHQKMGRLHQELSQLSAAKSYMAEDLQIHQASEQVIREHLKIAEDPKVKKILLGGMNSLASKAATILWNTETKEVYFNAQLLQVAPGKQYQLWAIVDGKPVDAGLVDTSGIAVFQKMKIIPSAQAFAVTIENTGGSVAPTLETMCLLGNV